MYSTPQRTALLGAAPLLLLLGCASGPVASLTSADHHYAQDEDEQKLIRRADFLDSDLKQRGLVLENPALDAYIGSVGARLVPAGAGRSVTFRFHVLRDPLVNAFALPNGSIYLNIGLLARLENEAQLAQVMGHEIAHVVQRHSLSELRSRKTTVISAHIADLVLFGTSIAYLPALGSLASHSQEAEKEADRISLVYMARAGYALGGAESLFTLLAEVREKESLAGSAYSSHPGNLQRATYLADDIRSGRIPVVPNARIGVDEYHGIHTRLTRENIDLKLNVKQYHLALESADRGLRAGEPPAWLHYYRGEALRLMAGDPEGAAREQAWIDGKTFSPDLVAEFRKRSPDYAAQANQAYHEALSHDATLVLAHRGLGLVAYAQDDRATAAAELRQYLANGGTIPDRRYINDILGRVEKP